MQTRPLARPSHLWSFVLAGVLTMLIAQRAGAQADNCANAQPLPMGGSTLHMTGFTLDGTSACGGQNADGWYTVTSPVDAQLVIELCQGFGSQIISLHSGCPGTAANTIICSHRDSYPCSGFIARIEAPVSAGRTYYVRFSGGSGQRIDSYLNPVKVVGGQGPDVVSGDIPEMARYPNAGDFAGMALGTAACNLGTDNIVWTNQNNSNQHPVISTSMYRLKSGIFEQMGYAWVKHGWAAGTETWCDECPTQGVFPYLIPGCTDTYDVPQNGTQSILGPRWEVNPTTGFFPYPPSSPSNISDTTVRRIRVPQTMIDPALNPGAKYYAELHYIAADDAAAGNAMNNASYRQISFSSASARPGFAGQTQRTKPAILAWGDDDPGVTSVAVDTIEGGYHTRYWIACKAAQASPGQWRYVYAVFNLNSNRAAAGLVLPKCPGVQVSGASIRMPPAHPGEVYSTTPWAATSDADSFGWMCTETFDQNPNANALHWGMMYTMIVNANTPPTSGPAKLKLFAPPTFGDPSEPLELTVSIPVPSGIYCPADFDRDGAVDFFDYDAFVRCFLGQGCPAGQNADFNHDSAIDFFDFDDFVIAFETPC